MEDAARQIEAEMRQGVGQARCPRAELVKLETDANKKLYRNEFGNITFRLTSLTSHVIEGARIQVGQVVIEMLAPQ